MCGFNCKDVSVRIKASIKHLLCFSLNYYYSDSRFTITVISVPFDFCFVELNISRFNKFFQQMINTLAEESRFNLKCRKVNKPSNFQKISWHNY